MALGAQPGNVQSMILGHSVKLTLIGVGLGLAGAFALVRFLTSLLFGVGAYDAVTFIGVPVLLAAVSISGAVLPPPRGGGVGSLGARRPAGKKPPRGAGGRNPHIIILDWCLKWGREHPPTS